MDESKDILFLGDLEFDVDQYPHYISQGWWSLELNGVEYFSEKEPGTAECTKPEFCVKNNTSSVITGSFGSDCCNTNDTLQPGETVCIAANMLDLIIWSTTGSSLGVGEIITGCTTLYTLD